MVITDEEQQQEQSTVAIPVATPVGADADEYQTSVTPVAHSFEATVSTDADPRTPGGRQTHAHAETSIFDQLSGP